MPAASYNELFGLGSHSPDANLEGWWPCMDNAASTTVLDYSGNGNNGTLQGGDNTNDLATTGPNSWITSALHLDGTNDYITLPSIGNLSDYTALTRGSCDVTSGDPVLFGVGITPYCEIWSGTFGSASFSWKAYSGSYFGNVHIISGVAPSGFDDVSLIRSIGVATLRVNGSSGGTYSNAETLPATAPRIGDRSGGGIKWDGVASETALLTRALTSGEESEWRNGPEPIVTSGSDSVSGTETIGQTLSASGATWGLDSPFGSGTNGTITYTYQWTRSDDNSGTNEADISGATSSTYTLQPADEGKFIRRRTRGSNDGGYDSAADHNSTFTGAIASSGSLLTTLLQHNHFAGGIAA